MTEHPLIFSAPMIRAILEGRKSVTRRLADYSKWKKGDRVWVRESVWLRKSENDHIPEDRVEYVADNENATFSFSGLRKVPSIHQPRWASRITLELAPRSVRPMEPTFSPLVDAIAEAHRVGYRMGFGDGFSYRDKQYEEKQAKQHSGE
jgi:hypothetical protein